MPRLTINDREHEYEGEGRNLLEVCLSLGYDVPYFCWHPAMHSVGACRQCAVKQFRDANDTRGRIVMACMTPASDGAIIATDDPEAVAFRLAYWYRNSFFFVRTGARGSVAESGPAFVLLAQ